MIKVYTRRLRDRGDWKPDADPRYSPGNIVKYKGAHYLCIQSLNPLLDDCYPDTAPLYWERYLTQNDIDELCDEIGEGFWGPNAKPPTTPHPRQPVDYPMWLPAQLYHEADTVVYNNIKYVCTAPKVRAPIPPPQSESWSTIGYLQHVNNPSSPFTPPGERTQFGQYVDRCKARKEARLRAEAANTHPCKLPGETFEETRERRIGAPGPAGVQGDCYCPPWGHDGTQGVDGIPTDHVGELLAIFEPFGVAVYTPEGELRDIPTIVNELSIAWHQHLASLFVKGREITLAAQGGNPNGPPTQPCA